MALVVKNLPANAGDVRDVGLIPGEGKGYPLQYSGLENSMDCSLLGSSVQGILQVRMLAWVAISSREFS